MDVNGDITIPAFVIRGLSKLDDPTDFASVQFGPESDLRDALATIWWLHGMAVRVEVDVPKCGRIDVLGRIGNAQILVELKREIATTSQARKAFQQANTYKAFLDHQDFTSRFDGSERKSLHTEAVVTCGLADWSVLFDLEPVFIGVTANDFTSTARLPITSYATRDYLPAMRQIATARREVVSNLSAALRVADRNLCTELEAQKGIAA